MCVCVCIALSMKGFMYYSVNLWPFFEALMSLGLALNKIEDGIMTIEHTIMGYR